MQPVLLPDMERKLWKEDSIKEEGDRCSENSLKIIDWGTSSIGKKASKEAVNRKMVSRNCNENHCLETFKDLEEDGVSFGKITVLRKQFWNFTEEWYVGPASIGKTIVLSKEEIYMLASSRAFTLQPLFRNNKGSQNDVSRFFPFYHWLLQKK